MGYLRFSIERNRRLETANQSHYGEPTLHPDRRMRTHDLVLLVKGSWEIREEETVHLLGPGDVVVLSAGRHHYGTVPCGRGTRTLWIHASSEPEDAYLGAARLPDNTETTVYLNPFIATRGDPRIYALFASIVRAYWSSSAARRALARVLFSELLVELSALSRAATDVSGNLIDHLVDYLEKHPEQFFGLDELAARIGVNRRTLTARFRQRTGESVHAFQTKLKIRMAAAVFDHLPETRIKEMAGRFGFHDEFHFSKTFKAQMGISPAYYKQRLIEGP